MSVEVRSIEKSFGSFQALSDVNLSIQAGELIALLGPSGSGKTTLLRIMAGLEAPDRGSVHFQSHDVTHRPVGARRVGFVFQHYALFRHMTVFENVAFGMKALPRASRPPKERIRARVHELLSLVQLDGLAGRYPTQLSGGQRQRVALARALAVQPRVLLLDEPFGALDAKVRAELRQWVRRLHDELHITSVFVTHDQEEALDIADSVVVMNKGRIEQIGEPAGVYHAPETEFVMNFLGQVNTFSGRALGREIEFADIRVESADGQERDGAVRVFVRPHELELTASPNGRPSFAASVLRIHAAGAVGRLDLQLRDGRLITAEVPQDRLAELAPALGSTLMVSPRRVHVFA